jgi:hypothetical protein
LGVKWASIVRVFFGGGDVKELGAETGAYLDVHILILKLHDLDRLLF